MLPQLTKNVTITTDGGCVPNPGKGGWAAILRYGERTKEISGGEENTTNNRMEMIAVIEALQCLKEPCRVTLRTDSMILVNLLNRTGKAAAKRANQDLVKRIVDLMNVHEITAQWVQGHNGDPDNERCDQLAAAWTLQRS